MCVARLRRVDIVLHVLHLLAPSNPFDKDHADDPWSFVPIFHSESTQINNLPITRRTSPEEEE
jgi:hypothetical protein